MTGRTWTREDDARGAAGRAWARRRSQRRGAAPGGRPAPPIRVAPPPRSPALASNAPCQLMIRRDRSSRRHSCAGRWPRATRTNRHNRRSPRPDTFARPASIGFWRATGEIVMGDFDGDGRLDLAMSTSNGRLGPRIEVLPGKSDGSFVRAAPCSPQGSSSPQGK
jgi:hypothetical protein